NGAWHERLFGGSAKGRGGAMTEAAVRRPRKPYTFRPEVLAKKRARYAEAAALRATGKTYNEIGQIIGVSGERVRQMLVRHGDASLIGRVFCRGAKTETRTCPVCGKEHVRPVYCPAKTCSRLCGAKLRSPALRARHGSIDRGEI